MRQQSIGEEIFSSVAHGIGAGLSIVGGVLLFIKAFEEPTFLHFFSYSIYSFGLLFLFLMSTLYHALTHKKAKHVFLILDTAGIFCLIAGTYTPFALLTLQQAFLGGWWLFGLMWVIATVGIVLSAIFPLKFHRYAGMLFLLMGWIGVLYLPALYKTLSSLSFWLVIMGGVCYSVGILWHRREHAYFSHGIWHLFVLAGSVVHFVVIWLWI